MKTKVIAALCLLLCLTDSVTADTFRAYPISRPTNGWDMQKSVIYWYYENRILNLRSAVACSPGKVLDIKMSPACNQFAVLYLNKKNKREVGMFSYLGGKSRHVFKQKDEPTAIAFTANARSLCIASESRVIRVYNTSDYTLERELTSSFAPKRLSLSDNGYYLAAVEENMLYVWNFEKGKIRKMIEVENNINHVAFSHDNLKMAVLDEMGLMQIYDTKTFQVVERYNGLRDARECQFHPEGKYIAVITATNQVTIINLKQSEAQYQNLDLDEEGICHLGYTRSLKDTTYLVFNAGSNFVFYPLSYLVPDYQQLLQREVTDKMDEWLKQMPEETLEEYYERVNDDTRAKQYAAFENEIATRMAGDKVEQARVRLGNYDQEKELLEISFDNMPEIYLEVPQTDVTGDLKPENLVFENSVYGVTEDDGFQLLYTEVTNKENGKKYIFNNLDKKPLELMTMDDSFVPLNLIQQSSMEEMMLQEIREEVVTAAKEAELISEHTHIDVKTKVEATTNADGEKIMNYAVEFDYDVEEEFSAKEDFGAGRYIIAQSQSATAMLRIVQNAFDNEFKQYIVAGKKVIVQITGSADAAPVKSKIPYQSEYGNFVDELVHDKGELTALTVTNATGITTNEQLAFLRAMGVQDYVRQNIPQLSTMQTEYDYFINVSQQRGSEYRRIGIKFVFVDAF